ncbi:MAG: hypothetical protein HQL57_01820 [Magnetococcales bacterium]|nr:hypothetical protein [Magnetococcales bacterium]MBF0155908.1 hypothetical protein [Magnetococcales bacterium]
MSEQSVNGGRGLSNDEILQLNKLKIELESMVQGLQNVEGKSRDEVEGRIREFQDKEAQIRRFLRERGLVAAS